MTVTEFKNHRGRAKVVALRFPIFGENAFTVAPFIFLHKKTAAKLDPYKYRLMLDHEMMYAYMQKLVGRRTYFRQYKMQSSFRYLVELRAWLLDARYLIFECGRDPEAVVNEIADVLSSSIYGRMVTHKDAVKDLCYYMRVEKEKRLTDGYKD